jgi:hypothetical protein
MRTKTTLKAPEGKGETVIDGTYYWPEEDTGLIETTNASHVETLIRHGYEVQGEVSIVQPAQQLGLIDIDELGRAGLLDALNMRGLTFPKDATRDVLVEQAHGWNQARRGPRPGFKKPETAPALAAPVEPTPIAPAPDPAPAPQIDADEEEDFSPPASQVLTPDFNAYGRDDLVVWLTSRGVSFKTTASKTALAKLAADKHAEIIAAKKVAA